MRRRRKSQDGRIFVPPLASFSRDWIKMTVRVIMKKKLMPIELRVRERERKRGKRASTIVRTSTYHSITVDQRQNECGL